MMLLAWHIAHRRLIIALAVVIATAFGVQGALAQQTVRIILPTKTYYPTIIAEIVVRALERCTLIWHTAWQREQALTMRANTATAATA